MHIGYNGPDLAKADTMLKKGNEFILQTPKEVKWHFSINSNRLEYTVSKVVDKKMKIQARCFFYGYLVNIYIIFSFIG